MSTKPFLTIEKQLQLLEGRGLIISDPDYAKFVLSSINYYRLSAYSLTLRQNDCFSPGSTFEDICKLYNFDARLRGLVLQYTSSVETTLRAHMAYVHAKNHSPLGYMDSRYFKDSWRHAYFLTRVQKLLDDSKEAFVVHHREDLNKEYPFWVVVEVMTFDVASKCLQNMNTPDQAEIARYYNVHRKFLSNWMHCTVIARNIAAHGGRFYNRPLATKPIIPDAIKSSFPPDRIFSYLYAIYHLLRDSDERLSFTDDLKQVLSSCDIIDYTCLGLPKNWVEILNTPI